MKTITGNKWRELTNKECGLFTGIVKWTDGLIEHFEKGNYHRLDGPAYENLSGCKKWYINGLYHRLDGPAVIWSGGEEYWINGEHYTKEEFEILQDFMKYKESI